jgi:hypothetical protein
MSTEAISDKAIAISLSNQDAELIYKRAVRRYIDSRRQRVPLFVDQHYTFKGSLALHKHSLGWDIAKAPVNAAASLLSVVKSLGAYGIKGLGAKELANKIDDKNLFLETKIGKEIAWNLQTQLLELPWLEDDRSFTHDALMAEVANDPFVQNQLMAMLKAIAPHQGEKQFEQKLTDIITEYVGSRAAASDISLSLMTAAAGWATLHKLTPGIASLSGSVASGLAHSAAIKSFWAGTFAGNMYYSVVGVTTPAYLTAGVFASLLIPASAIAAFAGVLADPVQRRLGLHSRRLNQMLDSVELIMLGKSDQKYKVRDHYVARIFDLLDWTQLVIKAT